MRNQRSNFIPVPTRPAKSQPKPLSRVLSQKKSCSCQTERVVLIKEENLTFFPSTRLGQNDGGMRRDYIKAVNYINSCHKFINTIVEKNADSKTGVFLLPMVTNFTPIFSHLIGKNKKEAKKPEYKIVPKSEGRKSKSSYAVKKVPEREETPIIAAPVGDCGRDVAQIPDEKYTAQVTEIVKEQIQQFLGSLQDTNKLRSESPKEGSNVEFVKQRLEELSKLCLQKRPPPSPPLSPPPIPASDNCSVILSDTDGDDKKKPEPELRITCYEDSATSLDSESSDIKSDSDLEINV